MKKEPKKTKSKKKSDFKRPERKKKSDLVLIKENPFKKDWSFPVTMSEDRFTIFGEDKHNFKSTRSKSFSPESALKIANKEFNPFFIDSRCIRLYDIKNEKLESKLWQLNSSSHTLYLWILYHLEYGNDTVFINRQDLQIKLGMSEYAFYLARKELIENNIISPSKNTHYYFINAQYFFLGNRSTYFPESTITTEHGEIEKSREAFIRANRKKLESTIALQQSASPEDIEPPSKEEPPSQDFDPDDIF